MEEKVFYQPGDVVTLRQDIPYKPQMIVVKKETMTFRPSKDEKKDEYSKVLDVDGSLQEESYKKLSLILKT